VSEPAIGVAIVSYNTAPLLRRCLESVLADTTGPVLVVDNSSPDGSADLVRREFASVRLLAEQDNRGYGAAANVAIRELDTRYVLLLNADTQLTPGTVEALAAYLDDHPAAAVAGPRIVNLGGTYEPSAHRFPTAISLLLHARWWPGPQSRPAPEPTKHDSQKSRLGHWFALPRRNEWRARPVDWILGAALVIRLEAFEAVRGFDEVYFLYQEEIDLCFRLRAAGWEIHYAPVATVHHVGGASTTQRAAESFGQFVRSTQRFARLRLSRPRAAGVSAVLAAVLVTRLGIEAAQLAWTRDRGRRERIRGRIAAWRCGLEVLCERGQDLTHQDVPK
jgi:N-acetylglucosaminyl-diphospho-decaprenol L-rhamnosyltransferase